MQKRYRWLLLGIISLGTSLRMPLTAIPPILDNIQKSFQLPASLLGSLTTIPLLCFAVLSPFVPRIASILGNEVTILIALLVLTLGNFTRVFSTNLLLIGTLFIGIAIAFTNVLVPAIITDHFPDRIGPITSLYTFSMTLFSAIGAGASAPLAVKFGWQGVLQSLAIFTLLIAVAWLPNLRLNHRLLPPAITAGKASVWRTPGAWWMTLTMGIQSLLFYTILTWLPKIMISRGLPQTTAGLMLGLFQVAALPAAYLVPRYTARVDRQQRLLWLIGFLFICGLAGLLIPSHAIWYLTLICIFLGVASTSMFGLCMTLFSLKATSAAETAAISGMAQAMGYLLAAVGPVSFGLVYGWLHSWTLLLLALILLTVVMIVAGLVVEGKKTIFD
ncbi:CynX/NimT family MFS transporter [Loigolactobacillus jiayinensis]|uniref:CynX/NimT family MFS transporter n=1 Tax=Loigolactobacillus jiayinensis TaxID=2486016 RepID=A0ABW1RD71_9LACO|nr:MFS transporter [Loigolactobacillus jiayinensis]